MRILAPIAFQQDTSNDLREHCPYLEPRCGCIESILASGPANTESCVAEASRRIVSRKIDVQLVPE
jgi:hypothetical protein